MNNQTDELMQDAIEKIKTMVDTSTVIGVPFETKEGTLIFPLTKVSIGFVVGGGEYTTSETKKLNTNKYPFSGGTGAGFTLQPLGIMEVKDETCKLIRISEKNTTEKILENIPGIIKSISSFFNKENKDDKKK